MEGNFRTDSALLNRATGIINLAYVKGQIIKRLSSIAYYPTASQSKTSKRAPPGVGVTDGVDKNPYSKPRLPFLKTSNRVEFANEWEFTKVEKSLEPAAFNARFRRRLRKSIKEEEEAKRIENERSIPNPEIDFDMLSPSISICETNGIVTAEVDGRLQRYPCLTENVDQDAIPSTFFAAIGCDLFKQMLPETKLLPGLEDFTFLLSPESQIYADTDHGMELHEKIGQSEKEKQIIAHLLDGITERDHVTVKNVLRPAEEHQKPITDTEVRKSTPLAVIPSVANSINGSCGVVADRAFRLATKDFSKKQIGRPPKLSVRRKKTLFAQYMELRNDAVARGIPVHCLPTMPPGTSNIRSKVHKKYYTVDRLTKLIDHLNSLKGITGDIVSVPEPAKATPSIPVQTKTKKMRISIREDRPHTRSMDTNVEKPQTSMDTTNFVSMPDLFDLSENPAQEEAEAMADMSATSGSVIARTTLKKPVPMLNDEFITDSSSEDEVSNEDPIAVNVTKRSEKRVEEDPLATKTEDSVSKRSSLGLLPPPWASFFPVSDFESCDEDIDRQSVASVIVQQLLQDRIIKDSDLISEIGSIGKRNPKKKNVKLSKLLATCFNATDSSQGDTPSAVKLDSTNPETILGDLPEQEEESLADLYAISASANVQTTYKTSIQYRIPFTDEFSMRSSDDEISDGDSISTVNVMKMLGKRIFKEEDLLSQISSTTESSVRKGSLAKVRGPPWASFFPVSDLESCDEDTKSERGSVASTLVQELLQGRIIKDSDIISEIVSIGKRQPRKKVKFSTPLSTCSNDTDSNGLSDSKFTAQLDAILSNRIVGDVLSDINSIGTLETERKSTKRKRPGYRRKSVEMGRIDVGIMSDLSGDEDIEELELPCTPVTLEDNTLKNIHHSDMLEISNEIPEEMEVSNLATEKDLIEFARYDDLGLSIWGEMRKACVDGKRQLKVKPTVIDTPDPFSICSGIIDEDTQAVLKSQICSAMGIDGDKYDDISNEYSVDHAKHPCSIMVSKDFHGTVTTLSKNPTMEFEFQEVSHTMHLFSALGFLNVDESEDVYRVTEQIQNRKEKMHIQESKQFGSRKVVSKLILKVSFYHVNPGEHLERLDNWYTTSKWSTPTAQLEFNEGQLVSDLRKCLHCIKDCVTTVSYPSTETKELNLEHLAFNTSPQWFMVIDDTVVYDGRYSDSMEAANEFARYSYNTLHEDLVFLDASKTHLGDLCIRFGYPYRLFHQNGCMHTIIFNGARLSECLEELKSVFPKYTQENTFPIQIKCELDDTSLAEWVVTQSRQLLEEKEYLFVCKKCAQEVLSSADEKPKTRWKTSFRIVYDSNRKGRIMDRNIGWKPFSWVPREAEIQDTEDKPDAKRRIYVQIPIQNERTKLYKFIQPCLLHKAIKNKRPPHVHVPKGLRPKPKAKRRGRKPKPKGRKPKRKGSKDF